MSMHYIGCAEIWGVRGEDLDASTSGVVASLFSKAADGEKGGDVYYISVCSSDMLTRVAVADVIGHGEKVSHIGQWLYESLSAHMNSLEGDAVLAELNSRISQRGYDAMTTAAVVTINRIDGQLHFSYAGHHPLLAYHLTRKRWETVTFRNQRPNANLLLGALPDISYDQEMRPVAKGDRLFLYTDGVIDAPGSDGQPFDKKRLLAVLEEASERPLPDLKKAVYQALHRHTGGFLDYDDVTFIALEVR